MTVSSKRLDQSEPERDEQGSNEEICRKHKYCTRLTSPAEVHNRDHEQDRHTERQRVRLEGRNGRYERAHTG